MIKWTIIDRIESISTIDSLFKKSNEKILIDNDRFCSGTLKKISRVTLKNSTMMHGKINKNCGFLIHDSWSVLKISIIYM